MANEIQYRHDGTGANLYATCRNAAGAVWSVTGAAIVALATANWATYAIVLSESPAGSYRYQATAPALPAGQYAVEIFLRADATAAITDALLAVGELAWDGAAEILDGHLAASQHIALDWSADVSNKPTIGTSTYAGADTAGTTEILSRLPDVVPTAADVAALILATPANKLVTDASGYVTYANAAGPSAADIVTAMQASGTTLNHLETTIVGANGVYRFTAAALALAPAPEASIDAGSAVATAAAVLDAIAADHQVAGSVAQALTDVKAKTDLLGSYAVSVVSPVAEGGELALVKGDDYLAADGRSLPWSVADWPGPAVAGAIVTLALFPAAAYDAGTSVAAVTGTGSASMSTTTAVFTAELTAAQTSLLADPQPGAAGPHEYYNYIYQLCMVDAAGHRITVATGSVHVEPGGGA